MDETKYKGRYRIPSARAWWHQYKEGVYYVTICTKNRENYFGRIEDGVMEMSEMGKCLNEQILLTSEMRADMNVEIPLFSIMPNHVHLIVVIGENVYNTPVEYDGAVGDGSRCRDAMLCVSIIGLTLRIRNALRLKTKPSTIIYDKNRPLSSSRHCPQCISQLHSIHRYSE